VVGQAQIDQAARLLEAGSLVAFPTETVYGLGADAENPAAVAKIYQAKGRPSGHPVIVHLAPEADIDYWVRDVPPAARQLIDAFWPGPLTLILRRAAHIPDAVSGGQDSIGLRCPSHPVAMALLRAFKQGQGGVAAPSANKFGQVSPTTAEHVRHEFSDPQHNPQDALLEMVLDGGASAVGIESTIIDLSRFDSHGPVLLRPGHISAEQIFAVIQAMPQKPDHSAPRASGTLASHYAPRTPVLLVASGQMLGYVARLQQAGQKFAVMSYSLPALPDVGAQCLMAVQPVQYAHQLYAVLRQLDLVQSRVILVELPPSGDPQWQGVHDRLSRAAHGSEAVLQQILTEKA
jgi:L-threonylcarbamoyladenylate synthase